MDGGAFRAPAVFPASDGYPPACPGRQTVRMFRRGRKCRTYRNVLDREFLRQVPKGKSRECTGIESKTDRPEPVR